MKSVGEKLKIACIEATKSWIKLSEALMSIREKQIYVNKSKYHK
jgi:hypothetical protein